MAVSVTHQKVSAIPDVGDPTLVEPSDWNATHTVTGLAAIATSGSATDLVAGTVPVARLPLATNAAVGAVQVDGTTITATAGVIAAVGAPPTGTAGGGLTGTYPNPTVAAAPLSAITGLGTGVATALAINVGTAGAPVVLNGAGGTPSSMTATNLTGTASGLTAGTASAVAVGGITGLGTGIATALAVNVGTAGAPVINGGDLGTPSAGVATNLSGTAASLTAGHVTTNANLTGPITSTGNATSIASQTGTGTKFVVDTGPTLNYPIHAAGTTGHPSLNLAAGTVQTTPGAGDMEFDTTGLFYSIDASTRGRVASTMWTLNNNGHTYTLATQTAAQKLFDNSTNGAVTVGSTGEYEFECFFSVTGFSATSQSFGFALGGGATFTQFWWANAAKNAALAAAATWQSSLNTAANVTLATNSTATVGAAIIKGIIRVTVTGTIIPQISLGTITGSPTPIVQANSYFKLAKITDTTATTIGNWS